MNTAMILWGFIIGMIGIVYFIYGKKVSNFYVLISGIAMMIYPYFISNIFISIAVGIALIILPFYL